MHLKAAVYPLGMAELVTNECRFSVEGIGDSSMAWAPANPGGRPVAVGDYLEATVAFTNLPATNAAFGGKTASISYNEGTFTDEARYEVFFPRDANNYPGGNPGDPNWFCYWRQTSANAIQGACKVFNWYQRSYYSPEYDQIYLGDELAEDGIHAWGDPVGIDYYGWGTAHELKHRTQIRLEWGWTNGIPDQDEDYIPDNVETNYMPQHPYDPTNAYTYGYKDNNEDGYVWDPEDANMREQVPPYNLDVLWINGSANDEDWTNPGKNNKNAY